jgi:hypothetical protein
MSPAVAINNPVQPAVFNQPIDGTNYASPAVFSSGSQQAEFADSGFSQPALPAAADPRVVLESTPPTTAQAQTSAEEQVPWRSPHGSTAGLVADNNYQPVQMQPIPTPSPQGPMEPQAAPRIRLPGAANAGIQSAPAYGNPVASTAVPQTLAITELSPYQSGALAAPPLVSPPAANPPWQSAPATTANFNGGTSDGFRARTIMR